VRNGRMTLALLAVSVVATLFIGASSTKPLVADDDDDRKIAIRDDCKPNADWGPGGCTLEEGDVTRVEFFVEAESPLAPTSVIGHQAWRNDPPYLKIEAGEVVTVKNKGGRVHTFTEVANFGGGRVRPPSTAVLNKGLIPAPECPTSTDMPPGASIELRDLGPGNHRFMCCIHSWMRAIVKVKAADEEDDEDDDEEEEN
jgi:plastocyanin